MVIVSLILFGVIFGSACAYCGYRAGFSAGKIKGSEDTRIAQALRATR